MREAVQSEILILEFENHKMYRAFVGVSGAACALTAILIVIAFAKMNSHSTNVIDAAGAVVYFLMGESTDRSDGFQVQFLSCEPSLLKASLFELSCQYPIEFHGEQQFSLTQALVSSTATRQRPFWLPNEWIYYKALLSSQEQDTRVWLMIWIDQWNHVHRILLGNQVINAKYTAVAVDKELRMEGGRLHLFRPRFEWVHALGLDAEKGQVASEGGQKRFGVWRQKKR